MPFAFIEMSGLKFIAVSDIQIMSAVTYKSYQRESKINYYS